MDSKQQDLKQQPFVKSKTTRKGLSKRGGQVSHSTVMSENLRGDSSEQMELFPLSSLAATRANHSAQREIERVNKTQDISGLKCIDLYESYGHDGSFARMLVDTLNSASTRFSRHWRMRATPSGRLLFQLAVSMPRTDGTEFGYWPTPTAHISKEGGYPGEYRRKTKSLTAIATNSEGLPHSSGKLNPMFVEWLMGFPINHTALKHSETQSSRKSRKQ